MSKTQQTFFWYDKILYKTNLDEAKISPYCQIVFVQFGIYTSTFWNFTLPSLSILLEVVSVNRFESHQGFVELS